MPTSNGKDMKIIRYGAMKLEAKDLGIRQTDENTHCPAVQFGSHRRDVNRRTAGPPLEKQDEKERIRKRRG